MQYFHCNIFSSNPCKFDKFYLQYLHHFQCIFLVQLNAHIKSIVLYICSNSMQFWQCSILLQFLQIINAKDFAFRSLQNLQSSTSADCTVSLHAMVHCNPKCIAVIPLQLHCNFTVIVCSVVND